MSAIVVKWEWITAKWFSVVSMTNIFYKIQFLGTRIMPIILYVPIGPQPQPGTVHSKSHVPVSGLKVKPSGQHSVLK